MSTLDQNTDVYLNVAAAFVDLADRIPRESYSEPALGDWTVQDLLGHVARQLSTVPATIAQPAVAVTLTSPGAYYAAHRRAADSEGIHRRGVEAGRLLADGPAPFHQMLADVTAALEMVPEDDPMVETRVGGMRLGTYLATRILEITLHSLDLARATGVPAHLPADASRVTVQMLTDLAMTQGRIDDVMLALAGREQLPAGFTVL